MFNSRLSKIVMMIMGAIIIMFSMIAQYTNNIINNNIGVVLTINLILIFIVYNYFNSYKIKDNNEIGRKNKLLMMFSLVMELIVFCGFIIETRFKGINTTVFLILGTIILFSYVVNIAIFLKNEMSRELKYIILLELVIIYASTITIASNWVFFVCLPMLAVSTIYGEDKLLKITGIILNVLTLVLAIQKVRIMDKSENPMMYCGIYMAILAIYVIFSICNINTSNMIGSINAKKLNEVINKQNNTKELSNKVIAKSREIKEDVQKTNLIVDELESISKKSSERFENIAIKNEENYKTVNEQREMTLNINNMIDNVRQEVKYAFGYSDSSSNRLKESKESVMELKNKSNEIINSNKEVIGAFNELIGNIKNIKNTITEIENISEQTSMLSLNGYIESARAAKNKSEFDVVASQINGLSVETYDLTNAINTIIINLENKTSIVREAIDNVMESVNEENIIIDKTVDNFNNMDSNLKELGDNITSISEKVEKVVDHSKKIEEKSKIVKDSSEVIVEKTKNASNINKNSQEKTSRTRELMNELVEIVAELDKYIQI